MASLVVFHVSLRTESPPTVATRKRFLSRVGACVDLQAGISFESFAALVAPVLARLTPANLKEETYLLFCVCRYWAGGKNDARSVFANGYPLSNGKTGLTSCIWKTRSFCMF